MTTLSVPALPSTVVTASPAVMQQVNSLIDLAVDRLETGVSTNQDCENARLHLSALQAVKTKLDKDRLAASAPFRAVVDDINALGKEVIGQVEAVQAELKRVIGEHLHKIEVANAQALTAAVQASATAPPTGRLTPALPAMPPPMPKPNVSTYEHQEITVTNARILPPEYLIPNMEKIRAAIKAGATIPGVTVTSETRVRAS